MTSLRSPKVMLGYFVLRNTEKEVIGYAKKDESVGNDINRHGFLSVSNNSLGH